MLNSPRPDTPAILASHEGDAMSELDADATTTAVYDAVADGFDHPVLTFWEAAGRGTVDCLDLALGWRCYKGWGARAVAVANYVANLETTRPDECQPARPHRMLHRRCRAQTRFAPSRQTQKNRRPGPSKPVRPLIGPGGFDSFRLLFGVPATTASRITGSPGLPGSVQIARPPPRRREGGAHGSISHNHVWRSARFDR